ncbi:MAG: hypothetical protein R2911_35325 [Caldilineaceae bacterium]
MTTVQEGQFVWLQLGRNCRPGARQAPPLDYDHAPWHGATRMICRKLWRTWRSTASFCKMPDGCYTFADPDGHWFQLVIARTFVTVFVCQACGSEEYEW